MRVSEQSIQVMGGGPNPVSPAVDQFQPARRYRARRTGCRSSLHLAERRWAAVAATRTSGELVAKKLQSSVAVEGTAQGRGCQRTGMT